MNASEILKTRYFDEENNFPQLKQVGDGIKFGSAIGIKMKEVKITLRKCMGRP
jgi:hypothetical protein